MKKTVYLAVVCLGAGLALSTTSQAQQSQWFGDQQSGQQQFGQQQQQMPGQMYGQQSQQLTEQQIRNFFVQTQRVLQQTARTQDPGQLQQYLEQYLSPDAMITSASELYIGDNHVATTVAHVSDEMALDALGFAASALQGRKLVSNYNVNIRVGNIRMMPGNQSARVTTVIEENGILGGPAAARVAQAPGQQQQWGQGQQQGFGSMSQTRQRQQGWGQMQDGQSQQGMPQQGMSQQGMGFGSGRGGAPEQGVPFHTRATCIHDVGLDQGQIRIGNTFCRGAMRLGS